ncbi:MAG: hypothetical protein WHT09_12740 [Thermogutta sp.]|jgi:hypothetical protein
MKSVLFCSTLAFVIGALLSDMPPFDWRAALIVGAIVAVTVAVVIVVAVLTPFIALQAGATLLGTAVAIGSIALVTGIVAAVAAGLYFGHQGDIKHQEQVQRITGVTNQLDIYFHPSPDDPNRAADFQCTLVIYEEGDLASPMPEITTKKLEIKAKDATDFYDRVKEQMRVWFTRQVLADSDGRPRRVTVYMRPYPGEGVFDRLRSLAENNGMRKCVVTRVDGPWISAVEE